MSHPHASEAAAGPPRRLSYVEYIGPDRLPPVTPRLQSRKNPDEAFFIRTHQAFEVWFAQILDEVSFARDELTREVVPENRVPIVTHHLHRAAKILVQLRMQLPLLETLLTTSFYDFRYLLFGASGFQSYRYRQLEWHLGLLDPDLQEYMTRRQPPGASPNRELESLEEYRKKFSIDAETPSWVSEYWDTDTARDQILGSLADIRAGKSLRAAVFGWLERTPYPSPTGRGTDGRDDFVARFRARFKQSYEADLQRLDTLGMALTEPTPQQSLQDAEAKLEWFLSSPCRCAVLYLLQYGRRPLLAWPAELLEAALAVDEELMNFRSRHVAMVSRVLGGGRISTGGQADSGLPYLRRTVEKKALAELWDARTFLLGHQEAEDIYQDEEWRAFRFVPGT